MLYSVGTLLRQHHCLWIRAQRQLELTKDSHPFLVNRKEQSESVGKFDF